jgi:cell division protein FtsQ
MSGRNRRTSRPPPGAAEIEPQGPTPAERKAEAKRAAKAAKVLTPEQESEKLLARAAMRRSLALKATRVLGIARAVLGVTLAIGIAGGLAWSARSYARQSPRFAVNQIDIAGNARLSVDRMLSLSELHKGMNIFDVRAEDAKKKLMADPWVLSAEVARKLPDSVSIHVTERKAAALVALGETMLATRDGVVFKRLEEGDPTDLPVVTCLDEASVSSDPEGTKRTIADALDLLAEYETTRIAQRYPAEELCARPDGTFALVIGKDGLSLRLGPAPYRRKLAQAERVLYELERRRTKADLVLLDNEARPDRVVVRVR